MNENGVSKKGKLERPALIDTSAWILGLREGNPEISELIDQLITESQARISHIIILELLTGTKTKSEFIELREDLKALECLELTKEVWERAYNFAFSLRRKGITIPTTDMAIMTLAFHYECHLIHADKHFDLMAENKVGLKSHQMKNLL